MGCIWVTQKATHKARVSRTEVTGHLASCWGQFHHFCMQTDVWVNGRSYVKKISEPVPLSLFPSNIPSKGEGRTALPRPCQTHSFKADSTLPSSGRSVHPNPRFHPFLLPLSPAPYTVAPARLPVSRLSSDTLHCPSPRPGYMLCTPV